MFHVISQDFSSFSELRLEDSGILNGCGDYWFLTVGATTELAPKNKFL